MSVNYKLVQRGNPGDPSAPKKFYATPANSGKVSLRNIGRDIEDISSLSYGDITNVLNNLITQVSKYLADGKIVSLGDLGDLRLRFSSEGVDEEAAFTPSKIRNVKIVFRAGKELDDKLSSIEFHKSTQ